MARTSELADRLHSVAIRLLRRVRGEDAVSGLSAARLSALSVLVFHGSVPIGRLAELEQVSAPTMSRLVRALEDDGLVRRRRDAADSRRSLVAASARGRAVLTAARERRVGALARDLEALSADDLRLLDQAATVLAAALSPDEP